MLVSWATVQHRSGLQGAFCGICCCCVILCSACHATIVIREVCHFPSNLSRAHWTVTRTESKMRLRVNALMLRRRACGENGWIAAMWSRKPGHALRPLLSAFGLPGLSSESLRAWLHDLSFTNLMPFESAASSTLYTVFEAVNVTRGCER